MMAIPFGRHLFTALEPGVSNPVPARHQRTTELFLVCKANPFEEGRHPSSAQRTSQDCHLNSFRMRKLVSDGNHLAEVAIGCPDPVAMKGPNSTDPLGVLQPGLIIDDQLQYPPSRFPCDCSTASDITPMLISRFSAFDNLFVQDHQIERSKLPDARSITDPHNDQIN